MKALVIEDNSTVRETLGFFLECKKYDVELVGDSDEALEYLRHEWPDLLFLDLGLPGKKGEVLLREIRDSFGFVPPTIVFSGRPDARSRAGRIPGTWFLPKPCTFEEFEQIIREAHTFHHRGNFLH